MVPMLNTSLLVIRIKNQNKTFAHLIGNTTYLFCQQQHIITFLVSERSLIRPCHIWNKVVQRH